MQWHATGIVRQLGLEHWNSQFTCLNFSAFSGTWKEFKLYADYSEISGIKPYNSLVRWHCNHGRVQVLSPSLSPCWSSDNHFWRHYQQTIRGFYCRINGWAIGATLPHSLGWSDRQAQTAKLVQSATGSLYWLCSKVIFFLMHCKFWAKTTDFLFLENGNVQGLSSAYCLAQISNHSLVSEQN